MWHGPMKVVVHENSQTIWTTMSSKLFRVAPEHVRPVTSSEARDIRVSAQEPSISQIAQQIPQLSPQGVTQAIVPDTSGTVNNSPVVPTVVDQDPPPNVPEGPDQNPESEGQPDTEPGITSETQEVESPPPNPFVPDETTGIEVPIPDSEDDELISEAIGLYSEEVDTTVMPQNPGNLAWKCEITLNANDIDAWKDETSPHDMAFVATAAKRQRSEVKLTELSSAEKAEFAKENPLRFRIGRAREPSLRSFVTKYLLTKF